MRVGDKLMIVGAIYALNLAIFVAFGIGATHTFLDVMVTLAMVIMAYRLTGIGERELKPFFTLFLLALLFNLANLLVWQTGLSVPNTAWSSEEGSNEFPLYYGFLGLFLFFWDCAWLYLTVTLIRRQGFGLANWVALLVLLGFVGSYIAQYREFQFEVYDAKHRILLLLFALELVGLLLGVMCALLGASRPYLFMIAGFAVFASIHIVGIHLLLDDDVKGSEKLQPLWTLGRAFAFTGIWMLVPPRAKAEADSAEAPVSAPPPVTLLAQSRRYSQLSSLLIVVALGAVFVVATFQQALAEDRQWFMMFFILFCVSCALLMSLTTSRLDRAISHVQNQMTEIFRSRLARISADETEVRLQRTLSLAGLDVMLAELRREAAQLREDVIVLGPERMNRPAGQHAAGSAPRCFIIMPFSEAWSAAVTRAIRDACARCDVQVVRGDDIFSPTDILDDIWQQIILADFVIADLTGSNANVYYELGMAHALGKPVILLAQHEDHVPIDLKTRRWFPYDPEGAKELANTLHEAISDVLNRYHSQASGAMSGPGAERPTQDESPPDPR